MNKLTWIQAVKLYSEQTGQKYKVPRKGTPQYDAVKKLMTQHNGMAMPKKLNTGVSKTQQKEIVNEVVEEILDDIDLSRASEMTKQILERHLLEARREINDTFSGEGLDDLLNLVPESIVPKKDIEQVKKTAMDVSKGNFDADELFASFKNIKKAVGKIDTTIKKEIKKQQGSGLTQLGSGILDDIAKLINPILPILKSVAPMPIKIATDNIENLKRDFDKVKAAINKVGVSVKKQQGSGLKQLGNGHQSGGFVFTIPLIISGLIAGAQALAAGAAGAVGARLATGVANAIEGKKF